MRKAFDLIGLVEAGERMTLATQMTTDLASPEHLRRYIFICRSAPFEGTEA